MGLGGNLVNRTVVTPNLEDVSMLYRSGYSRLGSDMPEYGGWKTPGDIDKGKLSKEEQTILDRLTGTLGDRAKDMSPTQLRSVAQTLGGKYGDNVTLVRLDPDLHQVFQDEVNKNPDFVGKMRSTPSTTMTLEFMEEDSGLPHGEATRADAYMGEPSRMGTGKAINESSADELRAEEDLAKKEWNSAQVKLGRRDVRAEVEQARGQAQGQDRQRQSFGQKLKTWWKSWTFKGVFNKIRGKGRQQPDMDH